MKKFGEHLLGEHLKERPPPFGREGTQPDPQRYRWVMLALLWLLYTAFGLVSRSISPLVTPILKDLEISYTQMGFIMGSWSLTYILVAIVAGTIIDRWGVRKALFTGALIMGLSAVLRYFTTGFWTMLCAVALFGAGSPMISIGAPKTISLWFQGRSRGTAVGIYTTGPRIGGVLALGLTNSVVMPLTGNDWRVTFVCYGVLAFGCGLLWWFLAKDKKPTIAEEGTGMMEVFRRLIRIRNVQIVLAMVLLTFATSHGLAEWLPKILEASGMSSTGAGFGASLPLVASIPAVIVIPRLIPSHLRGRFLAFFALLTIVTLLLVVSASGALLFVGLTIFGIANSLVGPLLILILMDAPEVGSRYMGAAGGMFFCAGETGGFTGPFIMGTLVDITGTFLPGAFFLVGLNLAILGMTLAMKTQPAASPQA